MDAASCSILRAQPFSSTAAVFPPSNDPTARFFALSKNNPNLVPSFSSTFPRNSTFPGKCLHFDRFAAVSSLSGAQDQNLSQELAVLLEVDGVLMDAAFKKLGLDCASWTEPVYLDLLRKNAGDEQKMVNLYFNRIGWPSSLPTIGKESFAKNVLQRRFIDDAYKEGMPVVVLTTIVRVGIELPFVGKLGEERISKLKIVVRDKEVEQSLYTQLVNDTGLSSGMDEQLAKEAVNAVSAEKQTIAEEVASIC